MDVRRNGGVSRIEFARLEKRGRGAVMGTLRLRIGFPETTAVPDAISQAIADWRETCQRADLTPVGDLSVELDTQDPERSALGEYVVNVTGDTDGHV